MSGNLQRLTRALCRRQRSGGVDLHQPLGLAAPKPQNLDMPIVSRYIAANGRPVTKLLTPSGVTAYVADKIPLEALDAWFIQLSKELGVSEERVGGQDVPKRGKGKAARKPR